MQEERAVHVARPQKAQQEKVPVCSLWRKAQEYYGTQDMSPKDATLEERGQKTKQKIVTFVKYGGIIIKAPRQKETRNKDSSLENN